MTRPSGVDPYNTADSGLWDRPKLVGITFRYVGSPGGEVWVVTGARRRYKLDPRLDLVRHSSAAFGWGYGGSSPAQLAIAILADAADDAMAVAYYKQFLEEVVRRLPIRREFSIDAAWVRAWVRRQQNEAADRACTELTDGPSAA